MEKNKGSKELSGVGVCGPGGESDYRLQARGLAASATLAHLTHTAKALFPPLEVWMGMESGPKL